MSQLAVFIRASTGSSLAQRDTFARSLPQGSYLDTEALRDHADEMLGVIADDLDVLHRNEIRVPGRTLIDNKLTSAEVGVAHGN